MNKPLKNTLYKRFSIILVGSVVVISSMVIRAERLLLTNDLQDKGDSIARILSSVTLDAILTHDYATIERYVNDIVKERFVNDIAITKNDGILLAGSKLLPAKQTLFTEYPIQMGSQQFGVVQISFSTSRIDTITWNIVFAAIVLIVILHVLGLVLTNLVLNRTVLKPLDRLQQAIKTITDGNLNEQVEPAGPREFEEISSTFNSMAKRLRSSFYEIKKSRQELDLERHKLAAIVASMADGLFVTDNDAEIVSFNNAAVRITGFATDDALGQSCEDLFRTSLCKDACAMHHAGEIRENVETTLITKDGRRLDVAVSSAILRDQDGSRIGGVQSFRDITAEKRRHELYCRTEKLAALGQLAAGVAHEMNNPLGNIIGYAKLITSDEGQEKIDQRVMVITEQARKCSDIVKGLLDYSRTSTSEPSHLDLNETIKRVSEVLQLQISKKDINLILELQEFPMLMADDRKIEQVIMNLALNAIQAVDNGGSVTIRTWQEENRVCLEVKDNGPGIPEELVNRIFDPFFTTKPVGKGTGLGLAICIGIIEELGGQIELNNSTDGAAFIVSIPRQNSQQEVGNE